VTGRTDRIKCPDTPNWDDRDQAAEQEKAVVVQPIRDSQNAAVLRRGVPPSTIVPATELPARRADGSKAVPVRREALRGNDRTIKSRVDPRGPALANARLEPRGSVPGSAVSLTAAERGQPLRIVALVGRGEERAKRPDGETGAVLPHRSVLGSDPDKAAKPGDRNKRPLPEQGAEGRFCALAVMTRVFSICPVAEKRTVDAKTVLSEALGDRDGEEVREGDGGGDVVTAGVLVAHTPVQ
jgi:hypothetical protein